MTSPIDGRTSRSSLARFRYLPLVLYAIVFFLEACLMASTVLRKDAYFPYLAPHYLAVVLLATCAPIALGLLALLVFATSMAARGRGRYLPVILVAVVTPLMCGLGFLFWMGAIYGTGSSSPVAQASFAGSTYRLNYATPGDPPMPSFVLLECRPVPILCREVGEISDIDLYQPLPPIELHAASDGLTVIVDDSPMATYIEGVLTCVPAPDGPRCLN
jgi:hypothetical protein